MAFFRFSKLSRSFGLFLGCFALVACSSLGLQTDKTYSDPQKEKLYEHGSLTGGEGFSILGGGKKDKENTGLGVNAFLWRAALDTISFMPIASADPFGGIITTDWRSAPEAPDERTKINVFIMDRELRADGIRVTVFRQTKLASGEWKDSAVAPTTASSLEETILTRARQLRLTQKEFK